MQKGFVSIYLLFLSSLVSYSQIVIYNGITPVSHRIKHFEYLHLKSDLKVEDLILRGQTIGYTIPYPDTLSLRYNDEILKSLDFYEKNDFESAFKLIKKVYKKESDNPFVINIYAKTLYKFDDKRDESFILYKNLTSTIQNEISNSDTILVLDPWFTEAYWKLGTLYMDKGDFLNATLEIGKFLCLIDIETCDKKLLEQVFSYLTECFYELDNMELLNLYANKTLEINPRNQYIKQFQKK